jgi:hypothetical protein
MVNWPVGAGPAAGLGEATTLAEGEAAGLTAGLGDGAPALGDGATLAGAAGFGAGAVVGGAAVGAAGAAG